MKSPQSTPGIHQICATPDRSKLELRRLSDASPFWILRDKRQWIPSPFSCKQWGYTYLKNSNSKEQRDTSKCARSKVSPIFLTFITKATNLHKNNPVDTKTQREEMPQCSKLSSWHELELGYFLLWQSSFSLRHGLMSKVTNQACHWCKHNSRLYAELLGNCMTYRSPSSHRHNYIISSPSVLHSLLQCLY